MVQTVDPRSAWALGDFRGSQVKLQLIGDSFRGNGAGSGGGRSRVEAAIHGGDFWGVDTEPSVAYQGERLTGRLIVQLANSTESGELLVKLSFRTRHEKVPRLCSPREAHCSIATHILLKVDEIISVK